jgi:3-dehydroquinate synthase
VTAFDLPVAPPGNLGPAEMTDVMTHDKKVRDGRVRFVLPRAIGRVEVTDRIEPELVARTVRAGRRLCRD